ncbi:MAG: hypothetical protein ACI86C_000543 [Candidatus Latescibacterota bacterium]|jgi:hypothetical protein
MKKIILIWLLCLSFSVFYGQNTKKVLVIGIDGCRSDALVFANTPNIDNLIADGVFSPDALNNDITSSGPGWSANLCGVWSNKHGVTNNSFSGSNYEEYPPFFKRLEDFDPTLNTASICHWGPINDFIVTDSADFTLNVPSDAAVTAEAVNYITLNDADAVFLHFDDVDHAGHSFGYSISVPQYVASIETVDNLIGPILQAVENRPNYANEDWLIVLTTDHGGIGNGHGGNSLDEEQVFYIASGKNIPTQLIEKEIIIVNPPVNCLSDPLELQFDGNNDVVSVAPNPIFNFGVSQDFTVECRVRTNVGGDVSIVGNKDWDTGLNPGFVLSFVLPQGEQWKVNIGDGSNRVDINTGGVIVDNEWYTLSVSFDRDGLMKMYLDGVFVDQANISGIGNIDTGQGPWFGADINTAYDFNGAIAEVRIWNTIVSETDIATWNCTIIDNSHPNYGDLLGYWRLTEDSGTTAIDSSVNGNNGAISGAEWGTPSNEEYDFSNTPRITDIAVTTLTHLCVPIETSWDLDGKSWILDCDALGVNDNLIDLDMALFPNPTTGIIHVNLNPFNANDQPELEIYTMAGQLVSQEEIVQEKTMLNLSGLNDGLYFVKLKTKKGRLIKKILKSSKR